MSHGHRVPIPKFRALTKETEAAEAQLHRTPKCEVLGQLSLLPCRRFRGTGLGAKAVMLLVLASVAFYLSFVGSGPSRRGMYLDESGVYHKEA